MNPKFFFFFYPAYIFLLYIKYLCNISKPTKKKNALKKLGLKHVIGRRGGICIVINNNDDDDNIDVSDNNKNTGMELRENIDMKKESWNRFSWHKRRREYQDNSSCGMGEGQFIY